MRTHGIAATYKHGCRCGDCTEAHRIWHAAKCRELAARPRGTVPHGLSGYNNWGCRCTACTAAKGAALALGRARRKRRAGMPLSALESAALAGAGGV